MAPPAPSSRPIVIRAQRDTVLLVATATIVTFALASTIHSRQAASSDTRQSDEQTPQHAWAGDLADLAPPGGVVTGEPLTSASLVVAKSELALPSMDVRPLVRLKGCEGAVCAFKAGAPTPARRPGLEIVASPPHRADGARRAKPSLIARLNPLTHLPDISALGKPFAFAGDTVSGWFRRF